MRSIIRENAEKDPNYAPYCMRCMGLHRMQKVAPFLWRHHCGAVHDEQDASKTVWFPEFRRDPKETP